MIHTMAGSLACGRVGQEESTMSEDAKDFPERHFMPFFEA